MNIETGLTGASQSFNPTTRIRCGGQVETERQKKEEKTFEVPTCPRKVRKRKRRTGIQSHNRLMSFSVMQWGLNFERLPAVFEGSVHLWRRWLCVSLCIDYARILFINILMIEFAVSYRWLRFLALCGENRDAAFFRGLFLLWW